MSRSTSEVLYRERPRCPPWVYVVYFIAAGAVAYLPLLVFYALGLKADFRVGALFLLPIPLVVSLFPLFTAMLVQVDRSSVRIGRFFAIAVSAITETHPISGDPLRRIRHEMMDLGSPTDDATWLNAIPGLGLLGSGLSMVAMGYRTMKAENRRNGMHCWPWQEPALLVETPSLPTRRWIIASREPAKLQDAINEARGLGPGRW